MIMIKKKYTSDDFNSERVTIIAPRGNQSLGAVVVDHSAALQHLAWGVHSLNLHSNNIINKNV